MCAELAYIWRHFTVHRQRTHDKFQIPDTHRWAITRNKHQQYKHSHLTSFVTKRLQFLLATFLLTEITSSRLSYAFPTARSRERKLSLRTIQECGVKNDVSVALYIGVNVYARVPSVLCVALLHQVSLASVPCTWHRNIKDRVCVLRKSEKKRSESGLRNGRRTTEFAPRRRHSATHVKHFDHL